MNIVTGQDTHDLLVTHGSVSFVNEGTQKLTDGHTVLAESLWWVQNRIGANYMNACRNNISRVQPAPPPTKLAACRKLKKISLEDGCEASNCPIL